MKNLVGITREDLIQLITENAVDGKWVVEGIELSIRADGVSIDVTHNKVEGFLLEHGTDMSDLYIHNPYGIDQAENIHMSIKHIAKVFGVDLVTGEVKKRDDTPVFDERDIEIAKLKGQLAVYRDLAPVNDKVTYESRA